MLFRISVANWRSLRDRQELSLVASRLKDDAASLLKCPAIDEGVLPAAAIYGANASGKSNFLSAVRFIRRAVISSARQDDTETDFSVPVEPFLLDDAFATRPSIFDVDFSLDGIHHSFGFSATKERIETEYLYVYPNRRKQVWYERDKDRFTTGKFLRGENSTIQNVTRPDALFLSTAATLNHAQLTPIVQFFRRSFRFLHSDTTLDKGKFFSMMVDTNKKRTMVELLRAADVGIQDVTPEALDPAEVSDTLFKDLEAVIQKHSNWKEPLFTDEQLKALRQRVMFRHAGTKGSALLDLSDQSHGTQKLLALVLPAIEALESGSTLLIDEIDTSLHPLLAARFVSLFQSPQSNPKCAQLIFTTHDTNLLRREVLRRDQIWFAEKSREGATEIYPLSDIKTRATDNIEKGYLEGRYGAIPFIGDISKVLASSAESTH